MTRHCHTLLVLVGFTTIIGCGSKEETQPTKSQEPTAVVITTAPLQLRSIQRSVSVVGTLAGYEEVVISPKVDGRVIGIFADIGDTVIPGAILLELDPADLKLEVEAARRGLEAELARLGLTAFPQGELKVEDVPFVRKADVVLANSQIELNRVKGLVARGALSQKEFDAVDLDFKSADANKRDAVTQALATLAAARLRQASLETAEQHLRDAKVYAPMPAGWDAWAATVGPGFAPLRYSVAARMLSEGEMIRSNPVTNAFKLVIDFALKLKTAVPEQFIAEVKIGQPVEVRVDAYPNRVFVGKVARVNPTVEPSTRTFTVEIAVPNLDGKLKAGGFARAFLLTRRDDDVKTIPVQSLVTFAGVNKVFVIKDDIAKAVEVQVGTRDKDWIEVTGTLPANAVLATSGFTQLVDGSTVQLRK